MNNRARVTTFLVATFAASTAFARPADLPEGAQPVREEANAAAATSCTDSPKLVYGGGKLIQHVKVVNVFYSTGLPADATGKPYKTKLEDFYKAITQSAHFDWLVEYNTTNYKIGRGSFLMSFEDTNANPATVKTVNPSTYLKSLLTAKKVPAPDDDTFYVMYFPSHVDPGQSCISGGGYCAYHSAMSFNGQAVRYAVMPDMGSGSCAKGCGPPGFDSFTDVSSHELIEAVTDPDAGDGWYDGAVPASSNDNCGEIGDICAVGGTGEGAVVNGFFVQNEWSNKNMKCIAVDPNVMVNDFTIAATPATVSVPAGGSATVMLKTTKTAGMAVTAMLTATATPPTGFTASLMPTSVTSDNGTSTVTINAAATNMVGDKGTVTVKGTAGAASPTVDIQVTVVAPADMAMPPDLAQAGGGGGGGGGTGGGGNGGSGGAGGTGGNGDHGNTGGCSCSLGGARTGASTGMALVLLAIGLGLVLLRRRAPRA